MEIVSWFIGTFFFLSFHVLYLLIDFLKSILLIYFLEKGEGRGKERERNSDVREKHQSVASRTSPSGVLAYNPGMCPSWESNHQPFGLRDVAQPIEPHQSGLLIDFRERNRKGKRETLICFSTYLCIHGLIPVCAVTRQQTCKLGVLGRCSNQLSYPAKAIGTFFSQTIRHCDSLCQVLG